MQKEKSRGACYEAMRQRNTFYLQTSAARREDYLKRRKASTMLNAAVARGEVIKPSACQTCGGEFAKLEAHHEDYNKPLDVKWLCKKCHSSRHRYLRSLHGGGYNSKYLV